MTTSSVILVAVLVSICWGYNKTYQEFIAESPKTFGLMTVTHARDGSFRVIANHLKLYAEMNCPLMTEIVIVWNNQLTPEQANLTSKPSWKRPVYFYQTSNNSMDERYNLPPESKAQVFFSMDDDVIIECKQLERTFQIYQSRAVGDISPIITLSPKGFSLNLDKQQFTYSGKYARYYSISLVGVAWIPRFYFQLYNTSRSPEINKIRYEVRQKNNCDDIALNFIVAYFFPELVPYAIIDGKFNFKTYAASQSLGVSHQKYRHQCIGNFTYNLGYNPLKIIDKKAKQDPTYFKSQTQKYAIYLKRKQLTQIYLQGTQFINDFLLQDCPRSQQILISNQTRQSQQKDQNLAQELKAAKIEVQDLRNKLQASQSAQEQIKQNWLDQKQVMENLNSTLITIFSAFVSLMVLVATISCYIFRKKINNQGKSQLQNSNEQIQLQTEV